MNALINGEIDLVEIVPPDLLPLLAKDKNIKVMVINTAGRQYAMRFNVLHKPFDNPKIRQAVLYALDQKPFLEANVGNPDYYKRMQVAVPLRLAARIDQGLGRQARRQHRPRPRQLLKEAGYDGTPVVLLHQTDIVRPQQPRHRRQAAARGGRLQGRPAVDGLADAGRRAAPRRTRRPRAAGAPTSPRGARPTS